MRYNKIRNFVENVTNNLTNSDKKIKLTLPPLLLLFRLFEN